MELKVIHGSANDSGDEQRTLGKSLRIRQSAFHFVPVEGIVFSAPDISGQQNGIFDSMKSFRGQIRKSILHLEPGGLQRNDFRQPKLVRFFIFTDKPPFFKVRLQFTIHSPSVFEKSLPAIPESGKHFPEQLQPSLPPADLQLSGVDNFS